MHRALDSSAALAWILTGEATSATEALLTEKAEYGAMVSGLWQIEIANVLWLAERRGRISLAKRAQALAILGELPVVVDERTAAQALGATLALASGLGLTAFGACYLELALILP